MRTPKPISDAHRARIVEVFARDVVDLAPESLLDVGCGEGLLFGHLAHLGIRVEGVDSSERRVAEARERDLPVGQADASDLPFEDRSFDWVLIRHVLHHLEDPGVAVREAWRVARTGICLAEPMTDPSIPSQRAMARFDTFTTGLMARAGHVHHPYLSAGDLIALVPGSPGLVETRTYGRLTRVPADEARALGLQAAHGRELGEEELAQVEQFAREAGAGELTYNGSTAVFVRR